MADAADYQMEQDFERDFGKAERYELAAKQFEEARALAESHGFFLIRHTKFHYQLWPSSGKWLLNIYPGNRRLFKDRSHELGTYLSVPPDWSLLDVVTAAVKEVTNAART